MTSSVKTEQWFDFRTFDENSKNFPPNELLKYRGLTFAWSADGTRILASGKDELDVADQLKKMGVEISQVVFDNLPDCDTIF